MSDVENKERNKRVKRSLNNLYEYYDMYSEDQVDRMLSLLDDDSKKLLILRYGGDLKNPIINKKMPKELKTIFYANVLSKMTRILKRIAKEDSESSISKSSEDIIKKEKSNKKTQQVCDNNQLDIEKRKNEISKPAETISRNETLNNEKQQIGIENQQDIKQEQNDKYIRILEIFNTDEFIEMTMNKPVNECVILALKLGYIDGKYFSSSSIANFLGIDKNEVDGIIRKNLLEYQAVLNTMIDSAITDEKSFDSKPYMKVMEYKK